MNALLKYGGVILVLIGVAILAIPQFMHTLTNTISIIGLGTIILGVIATIVLNKLEK